MIERHTDFHGLQAFVRLGDERAFAELVRRHVNLVFATALRKVTDPGAAEEITQNVFTALGRKAWQFAPDDSLPAWLHRTTILESKQWLRGELRRRRREDIAAELGTTMRAPDERSTWHTLVPLVDEALLSLREKDRTALLLRFYEGQSLREVAGTLGVNEDAARKRVASALAKLVQFFRRHGFGTATTAVAAALLRQTAVSAPVATVVVVVNSALQITPPTLAGLGLFWARLASLTKAQTAAMCLLFAALPVGWKWTETLTIRTQAASMEAKSSAARANMEQLATETDRLRARASRSAAALAESIQVQAQNRETIRQLELVKAGIRGLLTNADYHWPDDLPFVRVPKAVLSSMEVSQPVTPVGIVTPVAREWLGLTPEERQRVESALAGYFVDLNQRFQVSVVETNLPGRQNRIPREALASRVFLVPALGQEGKERGERLVSDLREVLGQERWELVRPALEMESTYSLRRLMNLDAVDQAQEFVFWIMPKQDGLPALGYFWLSGPTGFGRDTVDLLEFAPEGDQVPAGISDQERLGFPEVIVSRVQSWFRDEVAKHSTGSSKP